MSFLSESKDYFAIMLNGIKFNTCEELLAQFPTNLYRKSVLKSPVCDIEKGNEILHFYFLASPKILSESLKNELHSKKMHEKINGVFYYKISSYLFKIKVAKKVMFFLTMPFKSILSAANSQIWAQIDVSGSRYSKINIPRLFDYMNNKDDNKFLIDASICKVKYLLDTPDGVTLLEISSSKGRELLFSQANKFVANNLDSPLKEIKSCTIFCDKIKAERVQLTINDFGTYTYRINQGKRNLSTLFCLLQDFLSINVIDPTNRNPLSAINKEDLHD